MIMRTRRGQAPKTMTCLTGLTKQM